MSPGVSLSASARPIDHPERDAHPSIRPQGDASAESVPARRRFMPARFGKGVFVGPEIDDSDDCSRSEARLRGEWKPRHREFMPSLGPPVTGGKFTASAGPERQPEGRPTWPEPIEDEDEDPYDFEPPKGPSIRELRMQAAERGDVDYFLDAIRTRPWCTFSIGEMLRHLLRAAEVRARADPAAFSRELFSLMVGFNSFLLLRTQIYVAERVVGRGDWPPRPRSPTSPIDVVERLLPRLVEMQAGMAEILVAQAKAARLWGLTQAKEAQADRAVAADRKAPDRPRPSGGKAARSRPNVANARAEGPRDGVVPLPARGRRRG